MVKEGDAVRDPDREAPAPPPTLRKPGEKLPDTPNTSDTGEMKPVHFPKQQTTQPGQNPDDQPPATPPPSMPVDPNHSN